MDVTIGKYFPGNSFIHRLDPRIKLFSNILFIVLIFLTKSFVMEAILLSPILISYLSSGLKKTKLLKTFIPVIIIGSFLFLINVFIIKGDTYDNLNIYGT